MHQFIEAVLKGGDIAIRGQMRLELPGGNFRMMGLDAEKDAFELAGQFGRQAGLCRHLKGLDRSLDRASPPRCIASTCAASVSTKTTACPARTQIGAERAADRAGAPDDDRSAHAQGPSSSARVSATAIAQIASMSSSGRW